MEGIFDQVPPQLVEVRWNYGGENVYFVSEQDNWRLTPNSKMTPLTKSNSFKIILQLKPGIYKHKFYVDNLWAIDPKKPKSRDMLSNILIVSSQTTKNTEDYTSPIQETFLFDPSIQVAAYLMFLKTVIQVLKSFRTNLKSIRIDNIESLNAKLLCAVLQDSITVRDFMNMITLPPEVYEKKHGGTFVYRLFTSIIEQGGLELCKDFFILNTIQQYEICSSCSVKQDDNRFQNITIVMDLEKSELNIEDQCLRKFNSSSPCINCEKSVTYKIHFEILPKFLLLHTDNYFNTLQIKEQIHIPNEKGEIHIYDMVGCTVNVGQSIFKSITKTSSGWQVQCNIQTKDFDAFDAAVKYMCNGKITLIGYEKVDVRYPKPASLKMRKFRSKSVSSSK